MSELPLPDSVATAPRLGLFSSIVIGALCVMGALIVVALVVAGAAILFSALTPQGLSRYWLVSLIVVTVAGAGLLARYVVAKIMAVHTRVRVEEALKDMPANARERAWVMTYELGLGLTRKSRLEWVNVARSTGVNTWVLGKYPDSVLKLPRTDQSVEPERIATLGQHPEMFVGIAGLAAGAFSIMTTKQPMPGAIWLAMGAVMVGRTVLRGALFTPFVAGQGWIQHGKARWTVSDSVVSASTGRNSVRIEIVGPAGRTRVQYSTKPGKNQQLVDFWQRWTHPVPLLTQEAFVD